MHKGMYSILKREMFFGCRSLAVATEPLLAGLGGKTGWKETGKSKFKVTDKRLLLKQSQ
jgi:hypothetical protein